LRAKIKFFSGEGARLTPQPLPGGERDTPPHTHPLGASILARARQLDLDLTSSWSGRILGLAGTVLRLVGWAGFKA